MFTNSSLPKKADIFVKTKRLKFFPSYYKPSNRRKIGGIVLSCIVIFFSATMLFAPYQQSNRQTATPLMTPVIPETSPTPTPVTVDTTNSQIGSPSSLITISPIPSNPLQNQLPNLAPPSPAPSIAPLPQPNGQSISDLSSQIIATQQQISTQMQNCVNNATQMANQIIVLKNQLPPLQTQIDTVINTSAGIDASTPAGAQQQAALDQRRQQLQTQIDNLNNAILNAQNNFNTANGQCQQTVSQTEQQRETQEQNLDTAFGNAMNIQIPN
jgi:hypothetical protein